MSVTNPLELLDDATRVARDASNAAFEARRALKATLAALEALHEDDRGLGAELVLAREAVKKASEAERLAKEVHQTFAVVRRAVHYERLKGDAEE